MTHPSPEASNSLPEMNEMSNRQLTMTPALPSAPGRPREPGLPCKKENETKENWRKSLNHYGRVY